MTQTDASATPAPAAVDADPKKQVTGYCEPWALRAGELVPSRAATSGA